MRTKYSQLSANELLTEFISLSKKQNEIIRVLTERSGGDKHSDTKELVDSFGDSANNYGLDEGTKAQLLAFARKQKSNDFLKSLTEAHKKWGDLTQKQWAALNKTYNKSKQD